jgi:hypothetical protein
MYVCFMLQMGEIYFHCNMRSEFNHFKKKMKPFRT